MDILNQPYTNLLLAVCIATMIWLFWPTRQTTGRRSRHARHARQQELNRLGSRRAYWGVTLRGSQCDTVRPYLGKQFTLERAPALPLPGCKSRRCRCRYQGLVERRQALRRGGIDQRRTVRLDADHPDRRSGRNRRKNSICWKDPASHVGRLSAGLE